MARRSVMGRHNCLTSANISVFNFGLHMGWIVCAAKVLQSDKSPMGYILSNTDVSWLASSPSLVAMVSIPVWTIAVDRVGRKPCIMACSVLQTISWILFLCYADMTVYMIARLLCGIGGGGCAYLYPMYIKEISQDNLRGTLGLWFTMARNLGILAIYLMSYLEYYTMTIIGTAISIVSVLTLLKAPETPTYYVKIGKPDVAGATLAFLTCSNKDSKIVTSSLDLINAEDNKFKSIPNVTLAGIFRQTAWCKGFVIMILLMMCHSLNGGFTIVNYSLTILDTFGVTVSPQLQSLSVPIVMLLGSTSSMVLIERLGRKPILMVSFLLSALSFAALAAILLVQQYGGSVPSWLPVVVMIVPVFTYAAAVSPIPFVIMSEMFNFQIRAKVMGCLVMIGCTGAFIQLLVFGPVVDNIGLHVFFFATALINFLGTLVVLILLPETKMKSVEQIEQELERKCDR